MHTNSDASASNPVTKNLPPPALTKAEIVRRLREMGANGAGRLTFSEFEAILAAVYKLESQP